MTLSQLTRDCSSSCSCDPFHAPVDAVRPPWAIRYRSRWHVSPLTRLLWKLQLEAAAQVPQLHVDRESDCTRTKPLLLLLISGSGKRKPEAKLQLRPRLFRPHVPAETGILRRMPSPRFGRCRPGQAFFTRLPASCFPSVFPVKAKRNLLTRLRIPLVVSHAS